MRRLIAALTLSAATAGAAVPALAQEREFLDIRFNHDMAINGEKATATGTGYGEVTSGVMVIDFRISNYIEGYAAWPSSAVTNAGGGGGPVVAAVARGGTNPVYDWLRESPDNRLRHEKLTQDEYADLSTRFDVWIEDGTLNINVTTEGEAKYPRIIGMGSEPMVYRPGKAEGGGAVEELSKQLVVASGETITTEISLRYPEEARRPEGARTTKVAVLRESDNGLDVSLMYHNAYE